MTKKIYIFQRRSDLSLKIGISSIPLKRLSQLQSGSACDLVMLYESDLISNSSEIEAKIHGALKSFRMSGEWFSCEYKHALECVTDMMRSAKNEENNIHCYVEVSAIWAATDISNPSCCAEALFMAEKVNDEEFYSGLIFIKRFIEGIFTASDLIYAMHMDVIGRALKRIERIQLGFDLV